MRFMMASWWLALLAVPAAAFAPAAAHTCHTTPVRQVAMVGPPPSKKELDAYGLTIEDIRRYGNRTPAEVANMKKWGRILSQKDTFDGDYLGRRAAGAGTGSQPTATGQTGAVLVALLNTSALAACSALVLLALLATFQ